MLRSFSIGALIGAILAAAIPAQAERTVSLSFSQIGMNRTVDGDIVNLNADSTNRVWVVAAGRVSAVRGDSRATLFPLDPTDDNLPATADYTGVAFAEMSDGENFFLGSTDGMVYGRVTANGEEYRSPLLLGGDEDQINSLASDGSQRLWAATAGGLVEWDLTGATPSWEETYLGDEGGIAQVAVAPWGEAVGFRGSDLYVVASGDNREPAPFYSLSNSNRRFRAIVFDGKGNLWAVTDVPDQEVLRFAANSTTTRLTGEVIPFPFDPNLSGLRTLTDISVDPFSGRVWVVASGDQSSEAYYQDPDESGNLDGTGADGIWQANISTQLDDVLVVYSDPSGNTWFGTDRGITGRVVRLLSLDQSRYLGDGARAVAKLEDLPQFAGNGVAGEQVAIEITVGSITADLVATEDLDTGQFSFPFEFDLAGASPEFVPPNTFEVTSNTDGVNVTAVYRFVDSQNIERELIASASWANIVDFEDDLWIGGPCFLRTLGL